MKTTTRVAAIAAVITTTTNAATIVKWGESSGDTTMVTANASGVNPFGTTYSSTSVGSPANGTNGYADPAAGQTRTFYGAMSPTNGVPIINNNGGGDRIQMVNNFGGNPGSLTSMVVWQEGDFLTAERTLDSINVNFASRGGDGTTVRFLIETSSGWYQSDQSDFNSTSTYQDFSGTSGTLTWSSFSEFGVTGGVGAADVTDIQSVGLHSSSTNTSANFIGGLVNYYEVTAVTVPEPSGVGLLGLASLILLRRRRS